MKTPLTPEQKADKKQRDNLNILHNRIESAFSFKHIQTWEDVNKFTPCDRKGPLVFMELKEFLNKQKEVLEKQIKKRYEPNKDGAGSPANSNTTDLSNATIKTDVGKETHNNQTIAGPASSQSTVDKKDNNIQPSVPVTQKQTEVVEQALKDYGYSRSPNANKDFFPYWFQKKAEVELLEGITKHKKRGQLLLSSTGTGKTFISGDLARHLLDINFTEGLTFSHIHQLYVTRATIVEQTKRVFDKQFNMNVNDIEVINIEQLRSSAGRLWVKERMDIVAGEEVWSWVWKPVINPAIILWDECQALKNQGSTQHQIACAYNDLKTQDTYQVFISATPFTRVCEAKCFAVSTHKDITFINGKPSGLPEGTKLSNETWPTYAAIVAAPSKPDDYNESAVDRLMDDLDNYVVRVKGVKPQFDAINSVEMIHFETPEEKKYYEDTEKRYWEKKAKLDARILSGDAGAGGGIMALVLMNERCMAAELCRANHLAKKLYHAVQEGYAGVFAVKYKATMIKVVQILVDTFKVSRNDISLVWGGGQTQLTAKQKAKNKIRELSAKFEAMGMTSDEMIEDMDLDEVEDRIIQELDPSLRLGPQSPEDRQKEIDRFQSGKTLYCGYTFKAGGVGLSLHHSDEMTTSWNKEAPGFPEWEAKIAKINLGLPKDKQLSPGKVRRKESGYAFEEDIPFIPVRPRKNFVAPTYSAMELVQGLGRCPRLTSLSNTIQVLLFYAGTVEVDVSQIVNQKLRCLRKVVRERQKWADVITTPHRGELVKAHIDNTPSNGGDDSNDLSIGGEEGDEE